MKVKVFTINRGDIDKLINNLKHLAKLHDHPNTNQRYVVCNLLESKPKGIVGFFGRLLGKTGIKVIVRLDRQQWKGFKTNGKT